MKRLLVCCDGTWQGLASEWPTNVLKIAQAATVASHNNPPQIVYYSAGVGAEAENWAQKASSGLSGEGLDTIIQDAYRFLVFNYEAGDEIYLFGFSRGAYTVRSLSGLMYCSGLLFPQHIRKVPAAYRLYRDRLLHPSDDEALTFRQAYSRPSTNKENDDSEKGRLFQPTIELLACWDTVGALGIPDLVPVLPIDNWLNHKYEFHDTQLNRRVKFALHALAIDELRGPFTPALMNKSNDANTVIEQRWFAGDHTSIGGGNRQVNGLSDVTLEWMFSALKRQGLPLQLDDQFIPEGIHPDPMTAFDNKLTGIYRLLPHHYRALSDGVSFHPTVAKRWEANAKYRPENIVTAFGEDITPERWASMSEA